MHIRLGSVAKKIWEEDTGGVEKRGPFQRAVLAHAFSDLIISVLSLDDPTVPLRDAETMLEEFLQTVGKRALEVAMQRRSDAASPPSGDAYMIRLPGYKKDEPYGAPYKTLFGWVCVKRARYRTIGGKIVIPFDESCRIQGGSTQALRQRIKAAGKLATAATMGDLARRFGRFVPGYFHRLPYVRATTPPALNS